MNRQQKEAVVNSVNSLFNDSKAAFLVGYKGLTVAQMQSLRRSLRESGACLKVTKARLMKIAVGEEKSVLDFSKNFRNQVGLVFVQTEEVPAVAKKLVNFAKDNEALNIVSGYFESNFISKNQIDYLANLPSKEILIAQLMGTINVPASGLVRLMNLMIVKMLYALKQISEKGGTK